MTATHPRGAQAKAGGPSETPRSLQHPLLTEARKLSAAGDPKGAADRLETLAGLLKPPSEKAQVYALASQFVRIQDRKRSRNLAQQATDAQPKLAAAWMALSAVCDELQDRPAALSAALRAVDCAATPRELVDIGRQLSRLGAEAEALEAVRRGWEDSKHAPEVGTYTLRVALQSADWALANSVIEVFTKAHAAGQTALVGETPRTHLLWCGDEATNIRVISNFAASNFKPFAPMVTQPWPDGERRRLRIGYMSSDYRDHATSLLAMGMMRHHDRDRFELFAYCTSYDDGSALRRDILSRFDHARTFSKISDRAAAEQIVKDRIDVLVDLNGLTEGTRHGVLAWRPAPVQISYLGFPGTVGGRFVDYIIGDTHTIPEGVEALYPEKVIRIPPTYQINDYRARYLAPPPSLRKAGLPAGVPVIGMFNNVNKVGSEVWATWMKILAAVPTAVLWMLDPGKFARENLQREMKAAGVAPARVIFAPKVAQEAHLARLQLCDIVLDPWPYGGHTTTGDALFASIPVVALEGTNFASRVSGGLLRAAGLGLLVKPDIPSYIALAVSLLNQPEEVAKMKLFVRERKLRLGLFDSPTRTRQLEAAYLQAYRRSVAGQPPEHFKVRVKPPAPTVTPRRPATAPVTPEKENVK